MGPVTYMNQIISFRDKNKYISKIKADNPNHGSFCFVLNLKRCQNKGECGLICEKQLSYNLICCVKIIIVSHLADNTVGAQSLFVVRSWMRTEHKKSGQPVVVTMQDFKSFCFPFLALNKIDVWNIGWIPGKAQVLTLSLWIRGLNGLVSNGSRV